MRVAVVEPSAPVREAIVAVLQGRACVVPVSSFADLLKLVEHVDVVVADLAVCLAASKEEFEALQRKWPGVRLVVATPGDEGEYGRAATALPADGWLPKPRLGVLLPHLLDRFRTPPVTAR